MLNEDLNETIRKIVDSSNGVGKVLKEFAERQNQYATYFSKIAADMQKVIGPTAKMFDQVRQTMLRLDKAGLPSNMGENRSVKLLPKYRRLQKMGYALFWIPRATIIDELVSATKESERKKVITSNRDAILEDCTKALETVDSTSLLNSKRHIQAAIEALQANNLRAAQSTASICFDALLDLIVDSSSLTHYAQLSSKITTDGKKLEQIDNIPVTYLYAALQADLVMSSLRKFDRLQPTTVQTKFGRHSSVHTVSARQYNEFNALQSIMITVSLIVTTDQLGKGWLSALSNYA